ncbi:hypothetical protein [Streptomyces sp. NPDC093707]|uniref:hypothetical protein n=1 Tax=Streptomyces sp. NPDC093707 TaxID=3154984 RepID=UPI00344B11D0
MATRKKRRKSAKKRKRAPKLPYPSCPKCHGTYLRMWVPGPQVEILIDVKDPDRGVLAALVHADDIPATGPRPMTMCALCEADMGHYPRRHGFPAFTAALKVAQEGSYPRAKDWQVQDLHTDFFGTTMQQLVDAYDEKFTGEPQFRYGGREYDPPGQGAPEKAGQGIDHTPSEVCPEAGGQGVDHPLTIENAVAEVLKARQAEAAALEKLRAALRAEHIPGNGRELSRRAAPAMSRPLVLRAIGETGNPPEE